MSLDSCVNATNATEPASDCFMFNYDNTTWKTTNISDRSAPDVSDNVITYHDEYSQLGKEVNTSTCYNDEFASAICNFTRVEDNV